MGSHEERVLEEARQTDADHEEWLEEQREDPNNCYETGDNWRSCKCDKCAWERERHGMTRRPTKRELV